MNELEYLKSLLITQYDEQYVNLIVDGFNKKRLSTFRVNTLKGNSFEVEQVLFENDINFKRVKSIDIYSQTGNKKVYINYTDGRRELAYKYMSINSEFFELSAGKNNIYFETNSKDVDLNVSLEYKSLFAGI